MSIQPGALVVHGRIPYGTTLNGACLAICQHLSADNRFFVPTQETIDPDGALVVLSPRTRMS